MTIQEYLKKRPYFAWYIKDIKKLSDEACLEAILNYGDWKDVQAAIKILGMKKAADIFKRKSKGKRSNYFPEIKNYFKIYFSKHA